LCPRRDRRRRQQKAIDPALVGRDHQAMPTSGLVELLEQHLRRYVTIALLTGKNLTGVIVEVAPGFVRLDEGAPGLAPLIIAVAAIAYVRIETAA
jgi:hypothetical protein